MIRASGTLRKAGSRLPLDNWTRLDPKCTIKIQMRCKNLSTNIGSTLTECCYKKLSLLNRSRMCRQRNLKLSFKVRIWTRKICPRSRIGRAVRRRMPASSRMGKLAMVRATNKTIMICRILNHSNPILFLINQVSTLFRETSMNHILMSTKICWEFNRQWMSEIRHFCRWSKISREWISGCHNPTTIMTISSCLHLSKSMQFWKNKDDSFRI